MIVKHGAEVIGFLVEWLELSIGERNAVHIAEKHRARKTQLRHCPPELEH
jgi:hypothetical protein